MINDKALEGQKEPSSDSPGDKLAFYHLADKLLSFLPARSQDIIKRRFGLLADKTETLEKIGQNYQITRERVRQIIDDTIKNIAGRRDSADFQSAQSRLIFTIQANNGIIKESEAIKRFNLDGIREANAIKFLAHCSSEIDTIVENGLIERSWILSEDTLDKVRRIGLKAEEILEEERRVLSDEELYERISPYFPSSSKEEVLSFLNVLEKIRKNKFGKWGIFNWPEISPKGTREKIYLVLKETGRPVHFTKIAELIDAYQLGSRKAHPQTVHNELIKDERFVLIGRGIYALSEWGYFQGTIKDVLKEILSKSKKPLAKEEILSQVLKMRKVKKNTVLINLNNEQIFERRDNRYTVRR